MPKQERISKPKPRQRREEEPVEDVEVADHKDLVDRIKRVVDELKQILEEVDD